ncbi:hypothetical protein IGJ83_002494 [Enterococcus pernyi]|uniref:Holin n=1 Tax=Enterococcus mundtii TaxID=53346 RepID=A0A1V2UIE5_ENTMU|nr:MULTISPECIES: phage holin family protein [Enterococcus]ONN43080.1 holin [Enterococcus mundtii]
MFSKMGIFIHLFETEEELIHIFFLLILLDLFTGWLKAKVQRTWYSNLSWQGLWKKLSHFVLLILTGVVDIVLAKNNVQLEFTLVQVFTTFLVLTEIGSILENMAETNLTKYFCQIIESIEQKLKKGS